jgi:hypothetical protein
MIMMAFLLDRNLFAKNTMDSIKLSIYLFQGGMKNSGSKMCKIKRLDGTFAKIRLTLFLEDN